MLLRNDIDREQTELSTRICHSKIWATSDLFDTLTQSIKCNRLYRHIIKITHVDTK